MPTYQYACRECEHRFEEVQSFTDDALTTCPECSGALRKLFGSVGIVFKGSGFYRTDSRAAASASESSAAESSSSSSDGGSSDKSSSDKGGSADKGGSSEKPAAPKSDSSSSKSKESSSTPAKAAS